MLENCMTLNDLVFCKFVFVGSTPRPRSRGVFAHLHRAVEPVIFLHLTNTCLFLLANVSLKKLINAQHPINALAYISTARQLVCSAGHAHVLHFFTHDLHRFIHHF